MEVNFLLNLLTFYFKCEASKHRMIFFFLTASYVVSQSSPKNDFVVVVVVGDFHFTQILTNNRSFQDWINYPVFL